MTSRWRLGALAVSAVIAGMSAVLPLTAAADGSVTYTYVSGPVGDLEAVCQGFGLTAQPEPDGIGGACATVAGGTHIDVTIIDQAGGSVPALLQFNDANNNAVGGAIDFCGTITHAEVPDGAAVAIARVGPTPIISIGLGTVDRSACAPAPVTTGTITFGGPGVGSYPAARSAGSAHRTTPAAPAHSSAIAQALRVAASTRAGIERTRVVRGAPQPL
jgi:hypothetical protein